MSDTPPPAIGAILAGGQSSRMGRDKALVAVGGAPMLHHVAGAMIEAGCEPLVVGRTEAPEGLRAVADDPGGPAGPASGLATALRLAGGRAVFLAAADQPFLRPETIRRLLAIDGDAVVPVAGGTPQPTCAVYRRPCLQALAGAAGTARGPSLLGVLERVRTRRVPPAEWASWGEDGRSWESVDTPSDLERARRRWSENR